MNQAKWFESHALRLGQIVGNLLSLELLARMVIAKSKPDKSGKVNADLARVKEGDWVGVDALTNSDDLNQTLEKYNKRAPSDCRLDVNQIVRLRDALAHGRSFGQGPVGPPAFLRLLKFSRKNRDGKVQVEICVEMTDEWFADSTIMLFDSLRKVARALDYDFRDLGTV
jgi:hypothetical protein